RPPPRVVIVPRGTRGSPPLAPWPLGVPGPSATLTNLQLQHYPDKRRGPLNHIGSDPLQNMSGGVLLSHAVPRAVPSALKGLTSGFGMGPGVAPSLWPPKHYGDVVPRPHLGNRTVDACTRVWESPPRPGVVEAKPLGLLVPVSSTCCHASTSGLSTQSSSWGPYRVNPEGDLILRRASRLDAFSGYP